MADSKNGKNGVARRSTRVFENDIDLRQIEDAISDNGAGYNRKGGDREKSQERDRLGEMLIHTRTSSMYSLVAVDDDILGGCGRLTREISEDGKSASRYISSQHIRY